MPMLDQVEHSRLRPPDERREIQRACRRSDPRRGRPAVADRPALLHCSMMAGTVCQGLRPDRPLAGAEFGLCSSLQAMLIGARALQQGRADMVIVGGASEFQCAHAGACFLLPRRLASGRAPSTPTPTDWSCPKATWPGHEDAGAGPGRRRPDSSGRPRPGRCHRRPRKKPVGPAQRGPDQGHATGLIARASTLAGCNTSNAMPRPRSWATPPSSRRWPKCCGRQLPAGKKIPVTSVKANIGHALEAAGIAGVIKTVLCMQHKTIPPAINIAHAQSQDRLGIGSLLYADRKLPLGGPPTASRAARRSTPSASAGSTCTSCSTSYDDAAS